MHNIFNFSFVGYVGQTRDTPAGRHRGPHRPGQASRRRAGRPAAEDHLLRALPPHRRRRHPDARHRAARGAHPCRTQRMSAGWAPVSAVADRADSDQQRHTAGFDAAELAAVVGGRLLQATDRLVRGAAVDSRRVGPRPGLHRPARRADRRSSLPRRGGRCGRRRARRDPAPGAVRARRAGRPGRGRASWSRTASPPSAPWPPPGATGSPRSWSPSRAPTPRRPPRRPPRPSWRPRFRTLKSEGNENNEIGLPLTLLRLGPEHEAVVVEMGMYVAGDIAALAALAMPSVGVVTAVSGVHLERAGSLATIEIGEGPPRRGTAAGWHGRPQCRRPVRPPHGRAQPRQGAELRLRPGRRRERRRDGLARRRGHALPAADARPARRASRRPRSAGWASTTRSPRPPSATPRASTRASSRRPWRPASARPTGRRWSRPAPGGSWTTPTTRARSR